MKYLLLLLSFTISYAKPLEKEEWVLATLIEPQEQLDIIINCGISVYYTEWKFQISRLVSKQEESTTISIMCPAQAGLTWNTGNKYSMHIRRDEPNLVSLFDDWTYSMIEANLVNDVCN